MSQTDKPNSESKQLFEIQRVYVKDMSLESSDSPKIFREEWKPDIHIDLNIEHNNLNDDHYEVVLRVTATVKNQSKSVLILEVKQAAIFRINGFKKDQMDHMLKSYCPTILFPYAREVLSDMSVRATFPPINLTPINFDAIYMQQKEAKKEKVAKEVK